MFIDIVAFLEDDLAEVLYYTIFNGMMKMISTIIDFQSMSDYLWDYFQQIMDNYRPQTKFLSSKPPTNKVD